jgi:hypothetical protein
MGEWGRSLRGHPFILFYMPLEKRLSPQGTSPIVDYYFIIK